MLASVGLSASDPHEHEVSHWQACVDDTEAQRRGLLEDQAQATKKLMTSGDKATDLLVIGELLGQGIEIGVDEIQNGSVTVVLLDLM